MGVAKTVAGATGRAVTRSYILWAIVLLLAAVAVGWFWYRAEIEREFLAAQVPEPMHLSAPWPPVSAQAPALTTEDVAAVPAQPPVVLNPAPVKPTRPCTLDDWPPCVFWATE